MEAETPFQKVETFHKTFDPRRPEIPTTFTENEAHTRAAFKIEELVEFVAATSPNKEQLHEAVMLLHEALDKAEEKILGKTQWGSDPLVEQVDALTDILYFTYGSFSLLGIVPDRIFEIVHQANMGKLFPDGKPHYDPVTNKVLKPENWQMEYAPEPKIAAEIQRQIQEAIAKKKSADIGMCTNEKE
ncbi:HAD family hydrolase [Enterococcus faecium]|uniref:HAD family hydrolase n=1 Tax=Enterococcus faecium TaxID=1352 RepID=UPI00100DCEC1|nr:HAD family hydrolase [Enterococcus faecium]MDK4372902.1 HAD family hydrolase [Enterococcus faecium]RXW64345.1 HAD family hydrolase [Enterococcus faecium]RXW99837.1 HAD family hydrolase [Enterococcus faecium]TKN48187.1 HAD family hydrolase [Enterococcus faecium]TKN55279.1 HAD family hydrolase [Enterococcus faecium]